MKSDPPTYTPYFRYLRQPLKLKLVDRGRFELPKMPCKGISFPLAYRPMVVPQGIEPHSSVLQTDVYTSFTREPLSKYDVFKIIKMTNFSNYLNTITST